MKIISNKLVNEVSDKFSKLNDFLISIAYDSARQKAANALMSLNEMKLFRNREINISRVDFASMTGVAVETAVRTLSEFKKEGVIKILKNKNIVVIDSKKIMEIAELY